MKWMLSMAIEEMAIMAKASCNGVCVGGNIMAYGMASGVMKIGVALSAKKAINNVMASNINNNSQQWRINNNVSHRNVMK
jgi:hypothetical protein